MADPGREKKWRIILEFYLCSCWIVSETLHDFPFMLSYFVISIFFFYALLILSYYL